MKTLPIIISTFLISLFSFAGVGGYSGGIRSEVTIVAPNRKGYVAEVCDTTDSGIVRSCRLIYFNRQLNQPAPNSSPNFCASYSINATCDNHLQQNALVNSIRNWLIAQEM